MEPTYTLFLLLLFVVALLYSSVGHGGASGYLALMGIFSFAPDIMRPSALLLNVFVSLIAWWQYSRAVSWNKQLFLWLIVGSIPASFVGAMISIEAEIYKQILGALLLFQSIRLLGFIKSPFEELKSPSSVLAISIGVGIGFLSGLIGIGGGIILSPLLLILGWTNLKQTALISALFIFVNSLAGLAGLFIKGTTFDPVLYIWIVIALAGGLLGSWLGSKKFTSATLRTLLGLVLLVAGMKLIWIN